MISVSHILIPTDFSGCADAAVHLGFDFARRRGASIELMHVCESGSMLSDCLNTGHPLARLWYEQVGDTAVESVAHFEWDEMTVTARIVCRDEATESILERAAAPDVDLLVIGTHGLHSVRRFLNDTPDGWRIGQTARTIIPETKCPVLAVGPQGSRAPLNVHQVVAPVDDSVHALGLVEQAAAVAELYGVPLVLLHVLPPSSAEEARANARRRLTELARSQVATGYPVDIELAEGRPVEAIVHDASRRDHPLVILASHGNRGRGAVQIGSVADAVTRSAPCPVLTVKPFGKSLVASTAISGNHPQLADGVV
jgi:nucleotide-binding universal stress UspA family protein